LLQRRVGWPCGAGLFLVMPLAQTVADAPHRRASFGVPDICLFELAFDRQVSALERYP
jgi:hypothetical protein